MMDTKFNATDAKFDAVETMPSPTQTMMDVRGSGDFRPPTD